MPNTTTVSELIALTVERRHELGLSSEVVDHVAGLCARHTQEIEDAGRGLRLGARLSSHDALTRILKAAQGQVGGEPDVDLAALLVAALRASKGATDQPRIPCLDTFALIVQALGGTVTIEWDEPPPITRRLMRKG